MYPYWCLEKGYAKFMVSDDSPEWIARKRLDAKDGCRASMVVYTFSTWLSSDGTILNRVGSSLKTETYGNSGEMYVLRFMNGSISFRN